jgi:spermidine/putrescine transport system substrate-binding protein
MFKKVSYPIWIIRLVIVLFWAIIFYVALYFTTYLPVFKDNRSISMYSWSDRIDEDLLRKFETETGIRVHMNYYDSNEELITKLEAMREVDCDIMMPSDYIIEDMIKLDLLKKIDWSRCNFKDRLYPELMSKFYDPEDEYAIPLYWDVMSIGYSKKKFPNGLPSRSWEMIFEEDKVPCKTIGLINDAREMISLEANYLGIKAEDINKDTIEQMCDLLIKQKKWVGVYCDAQQGYFLLSGAYDLAVSQREYITRAMQDSDQIGCMVPEEGSLLTIDSMVISKSTKKDDIIYQFLNFLYSYEVLSQNARTFCFLPAVRDAFEDVDPKYVGIEGLHPSMLEEKNIKVFKNLLTLKEANKFWIRVKSA